MVCRSLDACQLNWCLFLLAASKDFASFNSSLEIIKGKASSLDIVPLTILNRGALLPRKWQPTGNDLVPRRTQWQPRVRANGLLGPQLQPAGSYAPVNHPRSSPRNPCT